MRICTSIKSSLFSVIVASCVSCSSVTVDQYAANQPKLSLEHFFQGQLTAHGVVKNRGGKVIRYFNARIDASWRKDGSGVLNEQFIFDDGEHQTRVWTLIPTGGGNFTATAGDVTGVAKGQTSGNSFFMTYVLQVPFKQRVIDVAVDDRMYLVDESVLLNESQLSKFGFNVGSVLLTIVKH
jgi:hypothetical protein